MRPILVTGNLGYVGTVLTPILQSAGRKVIGLDTDLYRSCATGEFRAPPTVGKDIRDVSAKDLENIDSIVHLAALSNDPLGYLDPLLTTELNHHAAVEIARAARNAGVRRFIFLSTCSVYGQADEDKIDENHPPAPITPYAESKWRAECEILSLCDRNFEVVVLRPGTAYGWSPKLRFDLVVNNLVAWARSTGMIRLKGDGKAWRPIVHVGDIAGIIAQILAAPAEAVSGQIFNLGRSDENYRTVDLAKEIADLMPCCRISFANKPLHDTRSYRVDCTRLSEALPGYEWRWTLRDGIRDLDARLGRLDLDVESFEGPHYSRSAHVLALQESGSLDEKLRLSGDREPAATIGGARTDRPRIS